MLSFVFFLSGICLLHLFRFFPITSLLLGLSATVFALAKRRYIFLLALLLGVAYALLRYSPAAVPSAAWNKELRLTGSFISGAGIPSENPMEVFRVKTASDEETGEEIEELSSKEVGFFSEVDADPGEEYEVLFKSGKEATRLNPGAPAGGRLYGAIESVEDLGRAAFSLRRFFGRKRSLLNDYILRRFGPDEAALVAAVTTGKTPYAAAGLKNDFNATGLTHLLSISGTHFGLFSVVMFSTFVFLIKRLPYRLLVRLTVYLTPRQSAALLCLPFMAFYLGLSGAAPPAVRSFVMIALFLAGLLLGRKGAWLSSLLFAAFLLALWDPDVLFGLSFQLSFVAVLCIGFAAERKKDVAEEKRLPRYVKKSVLFTLVASLGTAPLVVYHFHYLSVISPIANLIASPLIGSVLVLLSLISSFTFFTGGGFAFASLVSWVAGLSVALVKALAKVPFAEVKLSAFPPVLCLLFYAGFVPYLTFGKKKRLLFLPFLPLAVYAAVHLLEKRELSVTFLDVGQGDSAVVEFPDGKVVVVDTGRTGKETEAFLRYEGVRTIDAVAVTHVHPDHSGGLRHLLETFRVKEIWDNGRIIYPQEMAAGPRRRALSRGDVIEGGSGTITVLHPYPEFSTREDGEYGGENDSSLVLKVTGRERSVLFAGDVQEEAEVDLSHLGRWCRADVLKVPHHGSRTSANEAFLAAAAPQVAVISVGRKNPFGHPNPEVTGRLSGIKVFRTDHDGAVGITETEGGIDIKTYRDFALQAADGPKTEWQNIKKLFSKW
jgi:competence protein ComEC